MHGLVLPAALLLAAPRLEPVRVSQAPVLDGSLVDAAWEDAPASDTFVQKYPDEGRDPSFRTIVRVLYTDEDLYIGVDCEQAGVPVVSRLTRRDRAVESDHVTIDVDARGDKKSALHFEVNAAGVLVEGVRYDDTELALEWDDHWEAATARTDRGWSAEVRLPLRVLRFTPRPNQLFGLQIRRHVSGRQEDEEWAFIPRDAAGEVSRYGALGPFQGLPRPVSVELQPFVLGTVTEGAPGASAGLDGKLHLGRDLTLAVAAHPDFAQVEADEVVLNLTTFEPYFPEKRPFFLEGMDAFATPVPVLYTRRIGAGGAPIWGAAKLVGRPLGVTAAALSAVTGATEEQPTTFTEALRLRRELGDEGHVGLIGTATVRNEPTDVLDEHHDAYVGGVDGRWRSASGAYVLSGQALAARVANGPPRTLPDGTVVGPGATAAAATARAAKEGGVLRAELQYDVFGRTFDPNDAGFLERQNLQRFWAVAELHDSTPGLAFLEQDGRLEIFHRRNLDGLSLAEGYQINHSGTWRSFWRHFLELHWRRAHFDDREVGDGTALERAGLLGLELSVGTDPRLPLAAELGSTWQLLEDGYNVEVELPLSLNVLPWLDFDVTPALQLTDGEPRYAGDGLYARQHALAASTTLRAAWTFTPRLTLQAYAQLFSADVRYRDFSAPTMPTRIVHLDDLVPAPPPATDPSGHALEVTANVVVRWEYRLGSTLWLVYSRIDAVDVAMLKLAYWLG